MLRWAVDMDYLERLSHHKRWWLNKFCEHEYNSTFFRDASGRLSRKNLFTDKDGRSAAFGRKNRMRRDLLTWLLLPSKKHPFLRVADPDLLSGYEMDPVQQKDVARFIQHVLVMLPRGKVRVLNDFLRGKCKKSPKRRAWAAVTVKRICDATVDESWEERAFVTALIRDFTDLLLEEVASLPTLRQILQDAKRAHAKRT